MKTRPISVYVPSLRAYMSPAPSFVGLWRLNGVLALVHNIGFGPFALVEATAKIEIREVP